MVAGKCSVKRLSSIPLSRLGTSASSTWTLTWPGDIETIQLKPLRVQQLDSVYNTYKMLSVHTTAGAPSSPKTRARSLKTLASIARMLP